MDLSANGNGASRQEGNCLPISVAKLEVMQERPDINSFQQSQLIHVSSSDEESDDEAVPIASRQVVCSYDKCGRRFSSPQGCVMHKKSAHSMTYICKLCMTRNLKRTLSTKDEKKDHFRRRHTEVRSKNINQHLDEIFLKGSPAKQMKQERTIMHNLQVPENKTGTRTLLPTAAATGPASWKTDEPKQSCFRDFENKRNVTERANTNTSVVIANGDWRSVQAQAETFINELKEKDIKIGALEKEVANLEREKRELIGRQAEMEDQINATNAKKAVMAGKMKQLITENCNLRMRLELGLLELETGNKEIMQ